MQQILKVLVGSRAHGLHTKDSDYDWRGVFVLPTSTLLQINTKKVDQSSWTTPIDGKVDDTSFELYKFLLMATKSNPNILEMFVAPRQPLEDKRFEFLGEKLQGLFPHVWSSKGVYNAFLGYGANQRKKFLEKKDTRPHKYAVAYLRTLYNAVQLLETGTFTLDTKDTPIYETLRRWKNKDYTVGDVMQLTHDWEQKVDETYEKCEKKETNIEPINEFLLEVRKTFWD